MENVWLILSVCVISAGYIVFELQALGNKLKLYEHNLSELKNQQSAERKENEHIWNTISRLEKQIDDLRMELKGDRKGNDEEFVSLELHVKHLSGEFTSELNREKMNIADLQREIDRLQNKQEVTKIKMEKLDTDVKTSDEVLKELDKKANSLYDVLKNTVDEMQKLLGQVASMDDQILDLREIITTLSRSEYH